MKKFITASLIALNGIAFAADAGLNPQYLQMKIYKMAVSTSEYCTNPQVVFTNNNPVYEDILTSPTLGTGSLANGTYKCVIFEISDALKFAPDQNSDSGGCVLGQERTMDICRSESTLLIDGSSVNCKVGEDRVSIYMSIASLEDDGTNGTDGFNPPKVGALTNGIPLGNSLVVSGSTSGTFVVNGAGKVSDIVNWGERECELDAPAFSFR